MAVFMMEVSRSSRTGSWGPAWTLTHICWSHHQHHHKSILQHTHLSAPVTLAKTPTFCARTQWYLWWIHTCTPGHNSHRILYQTESCDDPKVPDQQGSATPTDGCKCSWQISCPPSAPQGQGSSRLGGRCFILYLLQSLVPTGIRHLMQVHRLPLCSPQTWCSNCFVLSAHWRAVTWKAQDIEWILQVASAAAPGEIWSNTIRINTFYVFF